MNLYPKLPETPGVYIMKDAAGKILYVGKAVNLKRRVSSYFTPARRNLGEGRRASTSAKAPEDKHDPRIKELIDRIRKINFKETDTAIRALVLESALIKKYQPPFNVKEKDDKSFLFAGITNEKFPQVLLAREKDIRGKGLAPSLTKRPAKRSLRKREGRSVQFSAGYGPFTSASSIREALRILRRIFPYAIHPTPRTPLERACFDHQIGLCPGTCIGAISRKDYLKNIENLKLVFEGKTKRITRNLERDMKAASEALNFERAKELKRQLFALQHIQDVAIASENKVRNPDDESQKTTRIEGYDISNISGASAVGSMVVFSDNRPDNNEYRKFKIKTVLQPNDFGMLEEVLERRLKNNWPLPDLFLIDGGKGQVNAVKKTLQKAGIAVSVVGIAKGPDRKRNDVVGKIPDFTNLETLIKVRDEAHRFAIAYHKKVRGREFMS